MSKYAANIPDENLPDGWEHTHRYKFMHEDGWEIDISPFQTIDIYKSDDNGAITKNPTHINASKVSEAAYAAAVYWCLEKPRKAYDYRQKFADGVVQAMEVTAY